MPPCASPRTPAPSRSLPTISALSSPKVDLGRGRRGASEGRPLPKAAPRPGPRGRGRGRGIACDRLRHCPGASLFGVRGAARNTRRGASSAPTGGLGALRQPRARGSGGFSQKVRQKIGTAFPMEAPPPVCVRAQTLFATASRTLSSPSSTKRARSSGPCGFWGPMFFGQDRSPRCRRKHARIFFAPLHQQGEELRPFGMPRPVLPCSGLSSETTAQRVSYRIITVARILSRVGILRPKNPSCSATCLATLSATFSIPLRDQQAGPRYVVPLGFPTRP